MDQIIDSARIRQTAIKLCESWRGTDPMRSEDDVYRAVLATGEVPGSEMDDVVRELCPMLRAAGLLLDEPKPAPVPWPPLPLWVGKLRRGRYTGDDEIEAMIVQGPDGPVLLRREGLFGVAALDARSVEPASLLGAIQELALRSFE